MGGAAVGAVEAVSDLVPETSPARNPAMETGVGALGTVGGSEVSAEKAGADAGAVVGKGPPSEGKSREHVESAETEALLLLSDPLLNPHNLSLRACLEYILRLEKNAPKALGGQLERASAEALASRVASQAAQAELLGYRQYMSTVLPQYKKQLAALKQQLRKVGKGNPGITPGTPDAGILDAPSPPPLFPPLVAVASTEQAGAAGTGELTVGVTGAPTAGVVGGGAGVAGAVAAGAGVVGAATGTGTGVAGVGAATGAGDVSTSPKLPPLVK
ncbi:hypothetical protein B484DRAFT_459663 [Ochromonadaceae sp. CCMP2298]|nr:hypothetical protein B484DRAFT_459663 [Ochromonadaceae sp. CCMP2298]